MTMDELKKLYGTDHIQGTEHQLKTLLTWTEELIEGHGMDWVVRHKELLIAQWEHILNDLI
jgi:hypothetical protein